MTKSEKEELEELKLDFHALMLALQEKHIVTFYELSIKKDEILKKEKKT
jgi:hypothetical protein